MIATMRRAARGQGTMEYVILLGTLALGAILTLASLLGRVR
jgi:hypothetical protein